MIFLRRDIIIIRTTLRRARTARNSCFVPDGIHSSSIDLELPVIVRIIFVRKTLEATIDYKILIFPAAHPWINP